MSKIDVGEYVRISHMYNIEKIGKIDKILDKDPGYKNMKMYRIDVIHQNGYGYYASYEIYKEDIIKHSKDIIDLIKKGDYVNRQKVQKVFVDPFTKKKRLLIEGTEVNWQGDRSSVYCESNEIKSVVTKEQYESVEYKLKEE